LSVEQSFLRVDFYNINGLIYFGELTFYPASGMGTFTDENIDLQLGSYLKL
ncbi:ATP-grasp fold amidoligase family protein, partial [Bacteroides uniformis]